MQRDRRDRSTNVSLLKHTSALCLKRKSLRPDYEVPSFLHRFSGIPSFGSFKPGIDFLAVALNSTDFQVFTLYSKRPDIAFRTRADRKHVVGATWYRLLNVARKQAYSAAKRECPVVAKILI